MKTDEGYVYVHTLSFKKWVLELVHEDDPCPDTCYSDDGGICVLCCSADSLDEYLITDDQIKIAFDHLHHEDNEYSYDLAISDDYVHYFTTKQKDDPMSQDIYHTGVNYNPARYRRQVVEFLFELYERGLL